MIGLLQGVRVLSDEAREHVRAIGAARLFSQRRVFASWPRIVIGVLEGEVRRRGNGLPKQDGAKLAVLGQVMVHDGARAGRLSSNGDGGGVATELADVLLDPCQRECLVKNPGVNNTVLLDLFRGKESKCPQLLRNIASIN